MKKNLMKSALLLGAVLMLMAVGAPAASAQKAGIGIEFGYRQFFAATDARFSGSGSVYRIHFDAGDGTQLFYHQESLSLTFLNTGAATGVQGNSGISGVGISITMADLLNVSMMLGTGQTNINNALTSSDSVVDLEVSYVYEASEKAFINVGLSNRIHSLGGSLAGTAVGGGTDVTQVNSLGGLLLHLGLGLQF